ncbi:MAG: ferredoxin [Nitrososphaerota archaeon]|nr:ferredoxin [Nitrososphaerota archaeon]MDG7030957.1 ferredoxin [Nitrososphaerota archaeon]
MIPEDRRVKVRTDWNRYMGSASCTELAPKMFKLDWSKNSICAPAPREVIEDKETRAEDIFRAAQSCPYRAIILEDVDTGDRLFPR